VKKREKLVEVNESHHLLKSNRMYYIYRYYLSSIPQAAGRFVPHGLVEERLPFGLVWSLDILVTIKKRAESQTIEWPHPSWPKVPWAGKNKPQTFVKRKHPSVPPPPLLRMLLLLWHSLVWTVTPC
jgi:hypothetical protein